MLKKLVYIVLLFNCTSAYAIMVDLTDYFPQTRSPRCWRNELWGGEYEDGF
jgi:hypothetical protein